MMTTDLWFAHRCSPDNGDDGPRRSTVPVRSVHGLRYGFARFDGPRHNHGTVRM